MREADDVLLLADDPRAAREIAALAAEHGWRLATETGAACENRWRVRRD